MKRWEGVIDGYMRRLEARGLASATINMRHREVTRFGSWINRKKPRPHIEDIGSDQILEYIKWCSAFKSKVTVYGIVSRMRDIGEYLLSEGIWLKNPLRWIQGPRVDFMRKIPRRIGKGQHVLIWEEVARLPNEYDRALWILLLSLLYGIGIRRGELERLELRNWDPETGLLTIDGRKTGRERRVPLPDIACQAMEHYLPLRQNRLLLYNRNDEKMLLINRHGNPMCGVHISTRIKKITKKAGISPVTMHQFRHSCASDLLEEGIGLCHVQQILGHAVITSTFRYTHVSDPARKEAMRLHPINRMLSCEGGSR